MKSRRAEKQNRDDLPDLQTRQETQESGFEGGDLSLDRFFGERIAIGRRDQKEAVLTD